MSYEKVKQAKRIKIGKKQTVKAINAGICKEVIIALDADSKLIKEVKSSATEMGIPISYVDSMKKLGSACQIQVGAASVAIIE